MRRGLIKKSLILQIGTVGAMLVQAVANIAIARMLGPEHFGFYAIAFSVAATASIVLGAGAVDALTPAATRAWHAGDTRELTSIVGYLLKFSLVAGVVAIGVMLCLPFIAGAIYHDASIGWFAAAIVMASLVSSLGIAILNLGLQLSGRYVHFAVVTLTDMVVRFSCSLALVWFAWGVAGATAGQLIGAVLMVTMVASLWRRLSRNAFWPAFHSVRSALSFISLRARLAPTLWVLGDRNLAMLFGALPIAIAGAYLVATDVSYFKVALGYVTLGLSVVAPISTVLNVEFPKRLLQEPPTVRRMFVKVSLATALLTTGIMVGLSIVGRWVIELLYGVAFSPAAPLVYALGIYGATFGIGVGLGPMWRALQRVRVSMLINALTLLIGIPVGLLLVRAYGAVGAVAMMTLWYVMSQGASFIYLLRTLRKLETGNL